MIACITTGRRAGEQETTRAARLAREWGLCFVPRQGRSIDRIREEGQRAGVQGDAVLVVEGGDLKIYLGETCFRYHPGMGLSRLRRLIRGEEDWMLRAMDLRSGDWVLDATMGLASDLLVASYAVGPLGRAVGLESEALVALVVREGLQTYHHSMPQAVEAMRRIEVVHADYRDFLRRQASRSFDVVYFDPMFEKPVEESHQIAPLRRLANPAPLADDALDEAVRVARRRVVVKDRRDGPYAASGRFDQVVGGPRSRIAFCSVYAGPK